MDGRAAFIFHFLQALWYPLLIDMKYLEIKMKEAALGEKLNKSFNRFNALCVGMQWYEWLRYYFLKYRRYIPTQERGNDKTLKSTLGPAVSAQAFDTVYNCRINLYQHFGGHT